MELELRRVIFQVVAPDGHSYKVYLDGRTEGFPKGSIIVNKALPLAHKLAAQGQAMGVAEAREGVLAILKTPFYNNAIAAKAIDDIFLKVKTYFDGKTR